MLVDIPAWVRQVSKGPTTGGNVVDNQSLYRKNPFSPRTKSLVDYPDLGDLH